MSIGAEVDVVPVEANQFGEPRPRDILTAAVNDKIRAPGRMLTTQHHRARPRMSDR